MPFSQKPPAHLKPSSASVPMFDYICAGPTCAVKVSIPGNLFIGAVSFYCDDCAKNYSWVQTNNPCTHRYFGVALDNTGTLDAVFCRECKVYLWTTTYFMGFNMASLPTIIPNVPSTATGSTLSSGGTPGWVLPGLWGGLISPEKKAVKLDEAPTAVLCISCQRETSKYLDAWYGNPNDPQGLKCSTCRSKR